MNEDANFHSAIFQLERERASGSPGAEFAWADHSVGAYRWPADTRRAHRGEQALPQLIRTIDNASALVATIFAIYLQHGLMQHKQLVINVVADVVALLVFFLVSRRPRLEHVPTLESFVEQTRFFMPAVLVAGAAQAAIAWWLGTEPAELPDNAGLWILAVAGGFTVTRGGTLLVLRHNAVTRRLRRKIAVVGHDRHAFSLARRLQDDPRSNVEVVGVFSDRPVTPDSGVQGSIADLVKLSQEVNFHGVVIALPPAAGADNQLVPLSLKLRNVLADVLILPYLVQGPDVVLPTQAIGSMTFMVLQRRPLDEVQKLYKRALDLVITSAAFIMFFAPMYLVVATLIKLDSPGPVMFRQPRRGLNNKTFTVYKFRTMHTASADLFAAKQTSRDDPRVTRIGKWLRRLSIDELPQMLNVLRGEMSLVGPRPHALHTMVEGELLDRALADYLIRYQVKPGITGWAQVNGARGELVTREDLRRRVSYDLEYIQRWSFRFDIKIIFLTAVKEIFSKHAF